MAILSSILGGILSAVGNAVKSTKSSTSQSVSAPTVTMPTQTARQRMLMQEEDDDRWYAGSEPTQSEILARIYTIGQQDPKQGEQLWNAFSAFSSDPSSPIYNPYSRATNKAVSEMAALGYDVSGGVNADWLKVNSGLMNHYRTGVSGTPLSPSSKSTPEENAAYWYYQIANAEERTQKAENEWAALQEEITYWTRRTDRNYSDQEILDRIDWSNYTTLTSMDEARSKGVPLTLNRAVGYSQDALAGVIWAARNDGGTGDPMIDSVKAALGQGNSWQADETISDRLNPMSSSYNPYAVGSTLDEAGLYFGVSDFSSEWLQENRGYLASRDSTAKKYYGRVYDAEQTTLKAEAELASLRAEIDDWLKYTSDPDVILDGLLDDYPTLSKMDESLRSGDLLATTRAIDFSRADIEAEVRSRCEAMNVAQQAGAYVQGVGSTLGLTIPHVESNDAIAAARDSAVNAAGASIRAGGTGEEKTVWETAYSADFDTYIGQIGAAINEGVTDPQGGYDYTLGRANEYAAQHYMGALEVIRPYQGALAAREEALQELAVINSWPEAEQQAAQERKAELEAQVRRQDRILAALEPKLTDAQREAAAVQSGYNIAGRMAALTGASEGDVRSTTAIMDYAYQYAEAYEPAWNSYSLYEMAMADGSSYADVAAAAHKGRIANKEQINRIRYTLTQLEKRGVAIDEKYIANMEREIARLEREVLDADYFLLRENENFEQVVGETRDKVNAAWSGWDMILPNWIDREGYSVLSASAANMAKGIQAGNFMPSMTQEERDTYLYILGTQGRDAAESYYAHMADETYGVLQTRTAQRATQFWEDFSAEHGLTGTALSVIASPMQAAGAVYAAKQGLTGGEINPYSGAFGAVQMVGATRGTVKEGITQKLGEGSTAAWLANLGYDAATGAADSLLNTMTFGSLGAATMGVNAASGSIQDATLRGATTEQALMLGGAMFLAETLTEQITVSNITKALNGGAPSVKGFFKTLLSDMGEEAVGEGASELLGQISDELIMKEMSVRQAAIAHYMDSGMTQQEAEERANKEAISGILYAAAVGGVSGGISTGAASMAGKAAQQPTNPVPQQPTNPAPQQPTNPAPVNPVPQQPGDDAPAEPQNEPQDAPKTTDEETPAPAEETPTEPQSAPDEAEETPEALTEEQRSILAKQVTALTQAMTTQDEASQTATIAAVLTAPTDDDTSTASAAAQHLARRYGAAKITDTLREILLTAAETRLDTEQLRVALTVASLGEGAASAALETVVSEGATAENVSEVLGAAESDMQAPEVMNTIRKTVAENQVAVRVKQLVAEGALSGIQSYETAVSQARSNLGTARENLRIAQEEYTTAGENMQTMQSEFSADPTNELLRGAFQQAIKDTEGKAIVVTQMQQSVDKYQAQLDEAQTTYNRMYEDTMKRVREQAQQDVLAMQEQLAQSRAAKAKIAARENAVSGAQGVTYTGDNAPIGFHYAVVDADGLIASNDTNMNVNPEYPQELQPRDRTRSSSREQIATMAAALNPARLGESADIQNGAPIVGSDFIVESGNGRVLAIQSAMQQGKSAGYTQWLRENAQAFGLDPSSITDRSVLVRVRDTDVDRAAFVKQANESTTASYSQSETAKSDAQKLTSDILLLYMPSESGEISSRENADFLTAFMQKVIPESEQAGYRQADGSISQSGIARIRNALFQKAYGDTNLTAAISESTDEGVKNMLKALTNVAPRIAVIAEQIAGGTLHDLNIAPDLTAAALAYRQLRKNGDTVEDYLSQYRMPGFETESETAQEFMRMFDKHKRSAKGQTQAIGRILDQVEGYGDPRQVGLFKQTVPELAQLVKSALEEPQQPSDGQMSIFAELSPVFQAITSARTSIKQIPALFKNQYAKFGKVNIDIGGGKFDLATKYLASIGTENKVFDPYNRGEAENRATLMWLQNGNKADTATCANVLNVIAEPAARANVILETAKSISPEGSAYFMVYEGDGTGVGRETGSGWQNNRKTADYVNEIEQYFDSVTRKGKMIIAQSPKANLPTASWEVQPGEAIRYARNWGAPAPTQGNGANQPIKSGDQIMQELAYGLGMPAETRRQKYLRHLRNVTNGYTIVGHGIVHVQDATNVETAAHEYGHRFSQEFNLRAHAPTQQMVNNLLADPARSQWIQQYPDAQRPEEAIAEYARYWIIDRNQAIAYGGQAFTDLWEQSLASRGWLRPMQQAAQDLRLNRAASAGERAMAAIDLTERRTDTAYNRGLRGMATALADYTLPLLELTDARRAAQGAGFDASKDVRTLLLARESVIANFTDSCLYDTMVDPEGNVVIDVNGAPMGSLSDILENVPREQERELNALWACLHARDRQDPTIAREVFGREVDVDAAIAEIQGRHPELMDVIDRAEAWYTKFMQTWLVNTGLMPQETFDMLRDRYPYYIPTFRSGMETSENGQTRIRNTNTPGNGVRRATGSTTNLYNPIMGLVEYTQRYIANYKHVEVLRAFDETMRTIPGLESVAEPAQGDMEVENREAANNAARAAVANVFMAQIAANGQFNDPATAVQVMQALADLPDTLFWVQDTATGDDVLNIPMEDGTISRWTVYNRDMLEAILAQPTSLRSRALKAIGSCTRFLCSMATGRSFSFALQNYASDTETAMNTGHGARTWLTFIPQQIGSMTNYLHNIVMERTGHATSEEYRLFQLFGQMGSRYAFRNTRTQAETRRRLYGGRRSAGEVARAIVSAPITTLEAISGFLEDSTRFNEFRHTQGADTYANRLTRGKNAREVTTDFSKRGKAEELKYARILIPFFGAQIQGLYKTARLFSSENAGNRVNIAGRILVNGMMTSMVLAAFRSMTWDDEEKEAYEEMSAYEKNKYWHFKLDDGTFVRVKRSQDTLIQFASALGDTLGNVLTGYEGDAWGDMYAMCKEIASNMVMSFDTVWDPLTDAANNQTWYGGAIEDYKMEGLSTTKRYEADTPKIYRYISGMLNIAGVKYSPLDVEYIIGQYTGSLGVIGSGILGLATEDQVTAQNIMGVIGDRLASRFSVDPIYTNNVSTVFYDGKAKMQEVLNEVNAGREVAYFRDTLTQEEANAAAAEADALMHKGGTIYEIGQQATTLWSEHDAILENTDLPEAERDAAAREVRAQINALLLQGNVVLADYFAKYGYENDTQQHTRNFLALFSGDKVIPTLPTAYDLMPQTFMDDAELPYMQQATSVWEATGKESALPHPNESFSVGGTEYVIEEADWDNWTLQYKMAYQKYLVEHSKGWDALTSEEQLEIMQKAHSSGHNAAKKWYSKLHRIK